MNSPRNHLLKAATAGMLGGIAGVFAMTMLQVLFDRIHGSAGSRPVRELSQRGGRHDIARLKTRARWSGLRQRDATVLAAERVARLLGGGDLNRHQRHGSGVIVHYVFGALVGAAYGSVAQNFRGTRVLMGLALGGGVWLFAEELALPALRLSDSPQKYPLIDHANALSAHIVYGIVTEVTRARIWQWASDTKPVLATSGKDGSIPPPEGRWSETPLRTSLSRQA